MLQSHCLNFCEITQSLFHSDTFFRNVLEERNGADTWQRVYFGSYFCSQYFLHLSKTCIKSLIEVCDDRKIKMTLVLPVFSEKDLEKGIEKIMELKPYFKTYIDEITVNDFGMLDYIRKTYDININLGRLLMKDYRDPRFPEYFNMELKPKIFTDYLSYLNVHYDIQGLEFDATHCAIDFSEKPANIQIGLHQPYCYITVGQICEFASIPKEIGKKFRSNTPCKCECSFHRVNYEFLDSYQWFKYGRTVYFENRECKIHGLNQLRIIYFPINLEAAE